MSKIAYVHKLPNCDLCAVNGKKAEAHYDGKIKGFGGWGFMCEDHFQMQGVGLGLGVGQRLVARPDAVGPVVPSGGE